MNNTACDTEEGGGKVMGWTRDCNCLYAIGLGVCYEGGGECAIKRGTDSCYGQMCSKVNTQLIWTESYALNGYF